VGALRPAEGSSQQPVALETAVVATGARPGDSAAKRELFTEETQTVLVFENGVAGFDFSSRIDRQSSGKQSDLQVDLRQDGRPIHRKNLRGFEAITTRKAERKYQNGVYLFQNGISFPMSQPTASLL